MPVSNAELIQSLEKRKLTAVSTNFVTSTQETPVRAETCPLQHMALIMDGNRRWAKQRCLPAVAGHKQGLDTVKKIVEACGQMGLGVLTVYAFSTENWRRADDEVSGLMNLFGEALAQQVPFLIKNNVVLQFIGEPSRFSAVLQQHMAEAEAKTAHNTGLVFQVALNYGGRDELVVAMQRLAEQVQSGTLNPADITEETIQQHLYTYPQPDPDLIIRTGGESRLSNFLMWQSAYSELLIEETLWPDFTPDKLTQAIETFAQRQRRFGA